MLTEHLALAWFVCSSVCLTIRKRRVAGEIFCPHFLSALNGPTVRAATSTRLARSHILSPLLLAAFLAALATSFSHIVVVSIFARVSRGRRSFVRRSLPSLVGCLEGPFRGEVRHSHLSGCQIL